MSQIFDAMYQYDKNTFSIIHNKYQTPELGDFARVFHRTALHKKEGGSNQLKIIEITETRDHKTDPNQNISIVVLENQNTVL